MNYNPKSLFNQIKAREQQIANSNGNAATVNEYLFKPKAGTTTVRLLWLPSEVRKHPMINSYVHKFYDPNANGQKFAKITCPTSQFMDDETTAGFNHCAICKEVSKFYKQSQEGSSSSKELYNMFRRTCEGFVPVYIVNGPDDIKGQIKILQYGKQFKDFFSRKIFGITKANSEEEPISEDEILGLDAFMYLDEDTQTIQTTGYDLLITTTTKPMNIGGKNINMPQYTLDFSRKPKTISEILNIDLTTKVGLDFFKNLNKEIAFDKDFFHESTEQERQDFVTKFIKKSEVLEEEKQTVEEETVTAKPTTKKEKKVEETPVVEETVEENTNSNDEEVDIDALLSDLKEKK